MFLCVPVCVLCSVHLSLVCLLHSSLCVGRSTPSTPLLAHVTAKTATAVVVQGSSLCFIRTHYGRGRGFVNQKCWWSSVRKRSIGNGALVTEHWEQVVGIGVP